jgi:hypothetical protein
MSNRVRELSASPCSLRDNNAALHEQTANLIDEGRPLTDQSIAGPMQALHVELLLALKLHEPHRRTRCRLCNRFGISIVVLV